MNGSERHVHVEERARGILSDDSAAAAYAAFVEDQLRHRRTRNLLAWLVTAMKILATHAP
jgi:hypothetical protein